jgi:23S rRNA (uracil1939-C5)-methyltransferase
LKRGDRVELELTDLSYFGDGVGHVDTNLVVFAAAGLPGERVVLEIDERRHKFVRGQIKELLVSAEDRVSPPCRFYGDCGGCQFQHLGYESQLRWKTELVRRQFQRIGNINPPDILPCIGSVNPWRYRNNARFSVDRHGQISFTRPKSHTLLPIDDCLIMQPEIAALIPRLQGVLPGAHQIVVRYGARTGQLLIAPRLPLPESDLVSGQDSYDEVLLGHRYRVSAPSFFQVNTRPDRRLVPAEIDSGWLPAADEAAHPARTGPTDSSAVEFSQADILAILVLSRLPLTGRELVVDAYSGVGTFAVPISRRAGRVVGIEEARSAVLDAEYNSRGLDNVGYLHGRTEDQIDNLVGRPDAVVLDPSRTGCDPKVLAALTSIRPETIVYVSCDPATLARDVGRLVSGGYELTYVQPIDMFPQTHHIETVSVLRIAQSPGSVSVPPSTVV